jgi:alpha-tubulin suppressor-like RCC1 family protein
LGLSNYLNIYFPIKIMENIQIFSTGELHTIFKKNESLYSFGENSFGQLGLGHNFTVNTPTILQKFTNFNILQISCGYYHTLILDSAGDVYSFGLNNVNIFIIYFSLVNWEFQIL